MSLKQDQVSALALELNRHLTGQFLSHCVQIDLASFSFSLSQSGRIVFVLDNPDPYLYVSDSPLEVTSLSSNLSRLFRKRLARAEILSVEALHEDRIIGFTLRTINDVFKEEILTLIVELIPAKANLILLDETKKVLAALRTNSITDKRPIFPGVTYTFPASATRQNTQKNAFVYDFYVQKCLEKEPGLYARRKKERFKNLFALLSRKKKSAERKIKAIEGDMAKAKEHLNDGEYGNFIYLDPAAIHPETGSMDYYGTPVPLDPRKSVSGNATAFFARAKKAKATLSRAEANLAAAEKERDEAILALSNLDDCDESA
ncbi:MAG: fibronectin/fibrinogen-binding protein, partial [Bacilli bacterium]|nr:fibronectin/fibrinogen-binding protein [Bacilli bacterium]